MFAARGKTSGCGNGAVLIQRGRHVAVAEGGIDHRSVSLVAPILQWGRFTSDGVYDSYLHWIYD